MDPDGKAGINPSAGASGEAQDIEGNRPGEICPDGDGAEGDMRRREWREENADALAEQSAWLEKNGHPLADIISGPLGDIWRK